ncbi:MAG: hypothetical protein QXL15_00960 [Candidatus Korarchaeota archaeon]
MNGNYIVTEELVPKVVVGVQILMMTCDVSEKHIKALVQRMKKENIELCFVYSTPSRPIYLYVLAMEQIRENIMQQACELFTKLNDTLTTAFGAVSVRSLSSDEIKEILMMKIPPPLKHGSLISALEGVPSWQLGVPDSPAFFPTTYPSDGIPIGVSVNPANKITGGRVSLSRDDVLGGISISGNGPRESLLYYIASAIFDLSLNPIVVDTTGNAAFLQEYGFQVLVPGENFFVDPLLVKNREVLAGFCKLLALGCNLSPAQSNILIDVGLRSAGKGMSYFISELLQNDNITLNVLGRMLEKQIPDYFLLGVDMPSRPSVLFIRELKPLAALLIYVWLVERCRYYILNYRETPVLFLDSGIAQRFSHIILPSYEKGISIVVASPIVFPEFSTLVSFATREPHPAFGLKKEYLQEDFVANMPSFMAIIKKRKRNVVAVRLIITRGYRARKVSYDARKTLEGEILKVIDRMETLVGSNLKIEQLKVALKSAMYPLICAICNMFGDNIPATFEEGLSIMRSHGLDAEINLETDDRIQMMNSVLHFLEKVKNIV